MAVPEILRDRDVFHDRQGRVYTALGYIQPKDRTLSYLKYIPSTNGKWKSGCKRYRRVFRIGVKSADESMKFAPEYLFDDLHFGTELLGVPQSEINRYFSPEEKLMELIKDGAQDCLEEHVVSMAIAIHDSLGVPFSTLGVTGSIVWGAHNVQWSDINMNVYGLMPSSRLSKGYMRVIEENSHICQTTLADWDQSIVRMTKRNPSLTKTDIMNLYQRREGFICSGQYVAVVPVLLPDEAPIKYGNEQYSNVREHIVTTTLTISDSTYGMFLPSVYECKSSSMDIIGGEDIVRLMIYDGSFRGLLREGDTIHVGGLLQRVSTTKDDHFYQIMVGTKVGAGREFICLLET